jgi:beta-glucosidase-like glycosyl hydrolase
MRKPAFIFFLFSLLLCLLGTNKAGARQKPLKKQNKTTLKAGRQHWVDSVYNALSPKERVGQLFMVAAYSGGENYNKEQIDQLIANHEIGGLIFMQGTPEAQATLTNRYQGNAQVPLLIGMDGEWGLGMRLTGVRYYPKQMTIGATRSPELMYNMGAAIAAQCKRMGVQIDFAPVVDVNNNPENPVINFRSFGDDKKLVAKMGIAYMKGLQDNGIMACAKHFPGHGDVSVDSHKDLPVINKSYKALKDLELYPFRKLIHAGVKSIMIAHLDVPALDNTPHLPTTLSPKVVTGLLRDSMGFKGLIFTDALNMKGVTKYYPDGETDLKAFLAGNDVLLFSQDVSLAISKIMDAVKNGQAAEEDLENRVKKILSAKYDAGLFQSQKVDTENITDDLNQMTDSFWRQIARKALTLVRDHNHLLQKIKTGNGTAAYINSNGEATTFLETLLQKSFPQLSTFNQPQQAPANAAETIGQKTKDAGVVIAGIHNLSKYPGKDGSYGLDAGQLALIQKLKSQKNVIFVVFGNPYLMKYLCDAPSVIIAYEDNEFMEKTAFRILKGLEKAKGNLPVHICASVPG